MSQSPVVSSQAMSAVALLDVLLKLRDDSWSYPGTHPALRTPRWTPSRPPTSTVDCLLEIRRETGGVPGRLGMFIGTLDVRRMAGFLDGYRLCLALAGARDGEYPRFERWLHEEKSLAAGQEWPRPFLQMCQGDDEQAIHRLLEFAAEFRATHPPSPSLIE